MKPGRELDALVAEEVMGWIDDNGRWFNDEGFVRSEVNKFEVYGSDYMWCPSTDIADAWEVVERVHSWASEDREDGGRGFKVLHYIDPGCKDRPWHAEVYSLSMVQSGSIYADGVTAPHAICLASLRACGVEVERD